ncbi:hypothetical protein [Yoonia sp. SDW83-1]|uniref:hypothetical protein n=1 Tax=Yoonia sp. SDW83-1 TaxID=3366945 RepID=UPI00398C2755
MSEITEFFVVRLSDEIAAKDARAIARPVFCELAGVKDWQTYKSTAVDRPTLFIEAFTFQNTGTAKAAGAQFSILDETKAFLSQIEEMIVGQHFINITNGETK